MDRFARRSRRDQGKCFDQSSNPPLSHLDTRSRLLTQLQVSSTEEFYHHETFHIIQGCVLPGAPPRQVARVQAIPAGTCPGRYQLACPGSYARVEPSPIAPELSGISLTLFFQPWLVGWKQAGHDQTIVSTFDADACAGLAAVVSVEEEIEFWIALGDGHV